MSDQTDRASRPTPPLLVTFRARRRGLGSWWAE